MGRFEESRDQFEHLRKRAEHLVRLNPPELDKASQADLQTLIEELNVRQMELQLQYEQLLETQNELTDLYENAPVGYLTFNASGNITRVNQTFAALVGQERGAILKTTFGRYVLDEDLPLYFRFFKGLPSCEESMTVDLRLRPKDGAPIHVTLDCACAPPDEEGNPTYRVAVSDRTETVRALEERERSAEAFREFIEHTPVGACLTNEAGIFEYVNPAYLRIYGYTREELIGNPFTMVVPAAKRPLLEKLHRDFIEGAAEVRGEWQVQRKNGDFITVLADAARVTGLDGRPKKATFVLDITERKSMERMLIDSERMAAVGILAAGVAHEFNNAMTAVTGFLSLMQEDQQLDARNQHRVEVMLKAADRVTGLTRNLLTFSRSEKLETLPTSLNLVVTEALDLVAQDLRAEGIAPRLVLAEQEVELPMVRNEIGQVLINFLINAQHALIGVKRKQLTIKTGVSGALAYIRVTDSGVGIPAEDLDQVLLPFFSRKGEHAPKDSPLTQVRGAGLGLAVADRIAKNHNGSIEVVSAPGEGATFTLWLPLPEAEGTPGRLGSTDRIVREAGGARAPAGTIIAIDDEPYILEFIKTSLEGRGHTVLTTDDGAEALAWCSERPVDVALVDLQMPKMAGAELLRKIADLPAVKRPVAVVITGRLEDENIRRMRREDVFDVIQKPFDAATLEGVARSALLARRA